MLIDVINSKELAIARSFGSLKEKIEMERQCIVSTVAYHLAIAPFSLAQLRKLDAARAKVLKSFMRVANSAPSQMLYLPHQHLGCGIVSLSGMYARKCADSFAACLNDLGRIGSLARAVLQAQMKQQGVPSLHPVREAWISSNRHMLLRKVAIMSRHQLYARYDPDWAPLKSFVDLYELLNHALAARCIAISLQQLQAQVIAPLWRAAGYTVHEYFDGKHFKGMSEFFQCLPAGRADSSAQRAYALLLHICCSPSCAADLPTLLCDPALSAPGQCQIVDLMPSTTSTCPASLRKLPWVVELSHIQCVQPDATMSLSRGCFYKVEWSTGPPPKPSQLNRLHRLGIHMTAALPAAPCVQVEWAPSVLNWSVIALFWPGKLAAFEAQQLQAVCAAHLPGVDAAQALQSLHLTCC